MNIKLLIAYDGTSYRGWQKTPMGPSIEESLEGVLEKILQHKVLLQAASRTDAGVHAYGQVVNFLTEKEHLSFDRLKLSLNQLLPKDISVLEVREERQDFHPTLDCIQKEYHYFLCYGSVQLPEHRLYSWHCPRLKLIGEMQEAAKFFIGKHDFSSFCNFRKQQHYEDYIREVFSIDLAHLSNERLVIKICGQNFLYKMVRNLVGTLVYVGMRKLKREEIPNILINKDRTQAGMTAPAHGLFLKEVFY